jgi:hypothetical protein
VAIDANYSSLVMFDRVQHCVVFGGETHRDSRPHQTGDCQIVGLGTAPGEHDVVGAKPNGIGNKLASIVDGST